MYYVCETGISEESTVATLSIDLLNFFHVDAFYPIFLRVVDGLVTKQGEVAGLVLTMLADVDLSLFHGVVSQQRLLGHQSWQESEMLGG